MSTTLDHTTAGHRLGMYVDGQLRTTGDRVFSSENPYTGRPWALLPEATTADVDDAVEAARRAFDDGPWPRLGAAERGRAVRELGEQIRRHRDTLARMETLDTGKILRETTRQVAFAARVYEYYAGYADKIDGRVLDVELPGALDYVVHDPVGVCALLTAWNSPMQLLANKLPAALVAGNCVVIRPSEHAPSSIAFLAELLDDIGIPGGVVNILTSESTSIPEALIHHPDVDLVSLTGGPRTGRAVAGAAGAALKRAVMELGGKSAQLVFADADLDQAVDGIIAGIFAASGQTCIAGSRLLVQSDVYDAVLDRLTDRTRHQRLGDPFDDDVDLGPIANRAQFERVAAYVRGAIHDGARLLVGGSVDGGDGLMIPPTVFADVPPTMPIACEEVFGPVLVASSFDDEDEAVRVANGTGYGLAAGIWTRDLSRSIRMSRRLRAGTVWVNTYRQVSPGAPFGGTGLSGLGRERGIEGLLEFVQSKNVMIQVSP